MPAYSLKLIIAMFLSVKKLIQSLNEKKGNKNVEIIRKDRNLVENINESTPNSHVLLLK